MKIKHLHVSGYRSLRNVRVALKQINVVVGENGTGKSNLYRSLQLLASAASGRFARDLASEGGMYSVLWGGNRMKNEDNRVVVEVEFEELKYKLSFGRIAARAAIDAPLSCFRNDPQIKEEEISVEYRGKTNVILKRKVNMISAKNMDGRTIEYPLGLQRIESVLSGLRDPQKFPELSEIREEFLNWRFYHNFRKDQDSPLRQPQKSVMTTVLSHDGADLAAALKTIQLIGQPGEMEEVIEEAFPGAEFSVHEEYGELALFLQMPGLYRAFEASELSDGTLQFMCMVAALMTERPPTLMVLNEPETSIHVDLYPILAKLIAKAATKSQIIVTTHARSLATLLEKEADANVIELKKENGETLIKGEPTPPDDDEYDEDDNEDFAEQRISLR